MKRIISIITAVLLVLGSYSLCFADNYESPYSFTALPVVGALDSSTVSSYGVNALSSGSIKFASLYSDCYLCYFYNGSVYKPMILYPSSVYDDALSNGTSSPLLAGLASSLVVKAASDTFTSHGTASDETYLTFNGCSFSDTGFTLSSPDGLDCLVFNSSSEAYDAFADFLTFPPSNSSSPVVTSSYILPCGNTVYIDLGASGASYDFAFTARYNTKLGILNDTWPNSHYFTFANTIPQTTSSFTPSVGTYITMYKGDDRDLLGQTYKGYGSITGSSTGRYLVIVNPLMFAKTTNQYNPSLRINGIPAGTTIYTYPVSSSIVGNEVMSEITSSAGGIGTASASGGAITTYSTEDADIVYIPNAGGNTVVDAEHNYVDDAVSSIEQTLSSFTQSVSGVLSAPIGHINQLISSGSNFFQHLSGLWSWLPSEVVATISGALSLVVTVAIFKVFL